MAIQLSVASRNAQLAAHETATGASPLLRIYDLTGAAPANCAAAIVGTLLVEMTLPADWQGVPANGASAMANGPWQDASANGTGIADFYRIYDAAGTTCHEQGTVSLDGGGGDMILDNTNIAAGQQVTITQHTLAAGNG